MSQCPQPPRGPRNCLASAYKDKENHSWLCSCGLYPKARLGKESDVKHAGGSGGWAKMRALGDQPYAGMADGFHPEG